MALVLPHPQAASLVLLVLAAVRVDGVCFNYTTISVTRPEPLVGDFFRLPDHGGTLAYGASSGGDVIKYNSGTRFLYTQTPVTTGSYLVQFTCDGTGFFMRVTVEEVNNLPPVWKVGSALLNTSTFSLQEGNPSVNTKIPTDSATDKMKCDGRDRHADNIVLTLLPGPQSDKFKLLTKAGENVISVQLIAPLDYEVAAQVNLTIRCTDRNATGGLVGTADFLLVVLIVNVKEKGKFVFEYPTYEAKIRANATVGTVIKVTPKPINATNPTGELEGAPKYSVLLADDRIKDHISISPDTAEVTLAKERPTPGTYSVTLEVVIKGTTSPVDRTTLRIEVLPSVDVPPQFEEDPLLPVKVSESHATGKDSLPIKTIRVKVSESPKRTLTFTVETHNDTFGFFGSPNPSICDGNSCDLKLIRKLDFEGGDREFTVKISVSDNLSNTIRTSFRVTVSDENDNPPKFTKSKYEFKTGKKVIGKVEAKDDDANSNIVYSLGNYTNIFIINEKTGEISMKDSASLPEKQVTFLVKASDSQNEGSAAVIVSSGATVKAASVMVWAVGGLGVAVGIIFLISIIGFCWVRKRAAARRGKQMPPEMAHDNSYYSYGVAGMTTLQENPVFGDLYGEEDGLEMDMFRSDRDVSEIQLSDTGAGAERTPIGGSIRTMMSSSNSFLGNSQTHLIPNGNSIKLSTNSMELVAADNAVNGSPIDATAPDGKDELTIYY